MKDERWGAPQLLMIVKVSPIMKNGALESCATAVCKVSLRAPSSLKDAALGSKPQSLWEG